MLFARRRWQPGNNKPIASTRATGLESCPLYPSRHLSSSRISARLATSKNNCLRDPTPSKPTGQLSEEIAIICVPCQHRRNHQQKLLHSSHSQHTTRWNTAHQVKPSTCLPLHQVRLSTTSLRFSCQHSHRDRIAQGRPTADRPAPAGCQQDMLLKNEQYHQSCSHTLFLLCMLVSFKFALPLARCLHIPKGGDVESLLYNTICHECTSRSVSYI